MNTVDTALREKLAAIEHERWSDWQKWCHQILRENCPSAELEMVLQRWDRQINTPYAELTLAEKDSDLEQVDRYWPLIEEYVRSLTNEAELRGATQFANLLKEGSKQTGSVNVDEGLAVYEAALLKPKATPTRDKEQETE